MSAPTIRDPRSRMRWLVVQIAAVALGASASVGIRLARAADPILNVYCAPGSAPTCFGVSLSTTGDGAGGTEVTLRLSNLQGASGFPIPLPATQPAWSRLYRVDIQGPDDGTFATDDQSSGVALSLAGGATAIGDTSMTWGIVPLEVEIGVARGFAVGTDIATSGAEIVGCTAPPDLGYPSISTCAANGAEPEVSLQFATRTAWTASQVTLTLLFQDPTGEFACRLSETAGPTSEPLRCERVGGPVTPPPAQSQTIAFTTLPPSPAFVGESYSAAATATSGLTTTLVSLTPSTCTIAASVVSFVAAGGCTIAADQPGNAAFLPAPRATQDFVIVRRPQAITFSLPASGRVGQTVGLVATGGASANAVSFVTRTPGVCTITDASLLLTAAGTCTVAANQAGSAQFDAAPEAIAEVVVTNSAWAFTGFLFPINDLPGDNRVKAGLIIPVRFGLGGNRGVKIFAPDAPSTVPIRCDGSEVTGPELLTVAAGGIPLIYNRFTDRYVYTWQTDRRWAGTCRLLTLRFQDGSTYSARFSFR